MECINLNYHLEHSHSYTASDALNDALLQAGVSYVFLNSGTDYPPIIESWAKIEARGCRIPEIIISPHETVAISAAQGYAQVTGQPQAVFVHVDVGTQNLGGALHNAFRCRVPVFILAGLSPYTIEGELKGGRDSYIQFIQNIEDQAGIVRNYTKMNLELKSGMNTQQMVYRALQVAKSEPRGPVYMMATREVLEQEGRNINADLKTWAPVSPMGLDGESLELLFDALIKARNPLIITSYLGRNKEGVAELVKLCNRLAVPVVETARSYMNFPSDHPMHLGFMPQPFLKKTDLVLVIDCDLPWPPSKTKLREDCKVFYLDIDPIKESIPIWYIPSERFMKADSFVALKQLNDKFEKASGLPDPSLISTRRREVEKLREELLAQREREEKSKSEMTSTFVTTCVREIIDDDTIVLNETISDRFAVENHLPRVKPGTLFGNGGSSLGWFGGAAIGVKLASPEKDVVALVSDGTYIFSCPTAVYWMARRYKTPFMTVIYNNQGWNAPKMITKAQHPDGFAVRQNKFWSSFDPPSELDKIAEAAGGAFARTVARPEDLMTALLEGKEAIRKGIPAVINVLLPPV
jgi:acetolactate synthase-1/2/3 large subunit